MATLNTAASERNQALRQIKNSLLEGQHGSMKGRSTPGNQHLRDRQTARGGPSERSLTSRPLSPEPMAPLGVPKGGPISATGEHYGSKGGASGGLTATLSGHSSHFSGLSSTLSGAKSMSGRTAERSGGAASQLDPDSEMKAVEQISFLEAVIRQQDERIEQLEAAVELVSDRTHIDATSVCNTMRSKTDIGSKALT